MVEATGVGADSVGPSIEQAIKARAYALGFDLCGITRLGRPASAAHYEAWVDAGRAGEMAYMARNRDIRADTRRVHPGATCAIVVAMSYGGQEPASPVARYARGDDYHDTMRDRLRALQAWIEGEVGHAIGARPYVDTAPILERDLARQAGLGWIGKNTNLIHPRLGSFVFLGSLFVDLELEPDEPFPEDHCGSCRRCIDACPTEAIVAPNELDARRCVSYLTIELRGPIPLALRPAIGGLLYGCDICQEVCPWNAKFSAALPEDSPYAPREALADRDARTMARLILTMSHDDYLRTFRGSAMKRATFRGLKRNATVVIGNVGTPADADVLTDALDDPEPLVHEHAKWAMQQLGG
ncbi:MAG: Epoxyqueuosine reductase [Gemmatimonadaceae bacterium]|nr:Epoxyqueuosine reductase [Gemmatimonadaceae bacterium]